MVNLSSATSPLANHDLLCPQHGNEESLTQFTACLTPARDPPSVLCLLDSFGTVLKRMSDSGATNAILVSPPRFIVMFEHRWYTARHQSVGSAVCMLTSWDPCTHQRTTSTFSPLWIVSHGGQRQFLSLMLQLCPVLEL